MKAVIYQPCRTAMQSGKAKTHQWVLELKPQRYPSMPQEPVMGWTVCIDTQHQVQLAFPTLKAAQAFADTHGITITVQTSHLSQLRPKSYGYNFTCRAIRS